MSNWVRWVIVGLSMIGLGSSHGLAQPAQMEQRLNRLEQTLAQERGQHLYRQACATCHGRSGNGNGPAALGLAPKPRDFTRGLYKFRSTPITAMPTDDDLLRTINDGIPGTSMPAWKQLLSLSQRQALVDYLKTFAADKFAAAALKPIAPIQLSEAPPVTVARIAQGQQLYERLQCGQCHGQRGRGDGLLATTLRDTDNRPVQPQNFTRGIYKSGRTSADLLRTILTGLAGTPMPAWAAALSPDEGWSVVYYVQSLSRAHSVRNWLFVDNGQANPGY